MFEHYTQCSDTTRNVFSVYSSAGASAAASGTVRALSASGTVRRIREGFRCDRRRHVPGVDPFVTTAPRPGSACWIRLQVPSVVPVPGSVAGVPWCRRRTHGNRLARPWPPGRVFACPDPRRARGGACGAFGAVVRRIYPPTGGRTANRAPVPATMARMGSTFGRIAATRGLWLIPAGRTVNVSSNCAPRPCARLHATVVKVGVFHAVPTVARIRHIPGARLKISGSRCP